MKMNRYTMGIVFYGLRSLSTSTGSACTCRREPFRPLWLRCIFPHLDTIFMVTNHTNQLLDTAKAPFLVPIASIGGFGHVFLVSKHLISQLATVTVGQGTVPVSHAVGPRYHNCEDCDLERPGIWDKEPSPCLTRRSRSLPRQVFSNRGTRNRPHVSLSRPPRTALLARASLRPPLRYTNH